jgi:heparin/heparan-sulfate lyase
MKQLLILLTILLSAMFSASAQQKPESPLAPNDYSWMSQIRGEHPRMFITKDDIPHVRNAAQTYASKTFQAVKKRADAIIGKDIVFENPLQKTGEGGENRMYGYYACDAALMWLLTSDTTYLDLTKDILEKLTSYYELRVDNNLNIEWYALSQVCAMCAWDWIYNDLTPQERVSYGKPLYEVMCRIAWHGPGKRPARFRENVSDPHSGCYGVAVLPWFIGLTFCNEGYDDAFCESMQPFYLKVVERALAPDCTPAEKEQFAHYLDCEAHTDVWRELFPTYNQFNEKH